MALKGSLTTLSKLSGPEAQKQKIFEDLGDLDQYELLDDQVLIAVYVESNVLSEVKGPDGKIVKLFGTENRAIESRFQGKAALIVKMGPTAFKWHNNGQAYEGIAPAMGDWVVVQANEGREIGLRGMHAKSLGQGEFVICRRVHWSAIGMRVSDPRVVH
jgi:hypothetical protein